MNVLLIIGLLLSIGYTTGWLLNKIGLPRIIGYIATGIAFSPNSLKVIDPEFIHTTYPILEVCLGFIAFEVGGALKWSKIKVHEKEIIGITILASLIPFLLIALGVLTIGKFFPGMLNLTPIYNLFLALLLGALASPTAPAATLAVIHQYHAKGKVTDTILSVAALDDVLGILLFSLTLAVIFIFTGGQTGLFGNPVLNAIYEVVGAIMVGMLLGLCIDPLAKFFRITGEGQWVVVIVSLIVLGAGISKALHIDLLLTSMTMGIVVRNFCHQEEIVFRILERYTEDLIFLFFFIISGLHLDITALPKASVLILLFVSLRTIGKYIGANLGAKLAKADPAIQKYTAGGLLPQAGVVIGLVLSIYQDADFQEIAEILLATIMGTTIIHELIGPLAAKDALRKAGEINAK